MATTSKERRTAEHYRRLLYTSERLRDPLTNRLTERTVPTPLRQAYEAAKQAYLAAARRYQDLRLAANTSDDKRIVLDFAQNASRYRQPVQDALAAWTTAGHKNEVEMMEDYIARVTGRAADS